MLKVSRKAGEALKIYPGPNFPAVVAGILDAASPGTFDLQQLHKIEAVLAKAVDDRFFTLDVGVAEIQGNRVQVFAGAHPAWRIDRTEVAQARIINPELEDVA